MQVGKGLEGKTEVRIKRILERGRNALIKKESLDDSVEGWEIYLPQPVPLKGNIKYIYRQMKGPLKDYQLSTLTLTEIENLLLDMKDRPIIAIDYIEGISLKPALSYHRLYRGGYKFVAYQRRGSFRNYRDPEVKRFLDTFELVNPEYIGDMVHQRDLTPAVIFVASLVFIGYFFKIFLMAENSPNTFYMAIVWLSWAVFLLVRSIIYVSYARRPWGRR